MTSACRTRTKKPPAFVVGDLVLLANQKRKNELLEEAIYERQGGLLTALELMRVRMQLERNQPFQVAKVYRDGFSQQLGFSLCLPNSVRELTGPYPERELVLVPRTPVRVRVKKEVA